ncbi:5' nucleotidase, NT5C type [Alkalihalobacillus pseudalcaliphilus]|uniref:5' nucleotidase, NT5C type n=1 Tax=Alkalihalobacillus pseudalcaliphilus TaxID=79884 RepID=UPI00064D95AA|nr:nucleotidase [Alkalihalobacillus pseudalcaliphilus]KMK75982.1 nucleotidase [Alkalihalobacillus pseudalcaliphilus]
MREKKRFGLDIDGTVTDPATFIPYLNRDFNKTLHLDDLTEYDLTSVLNITTNEFWDWMELNEQNIYLEAKMAADAEETIHEWSQNHTLIYITARRNHLFDATKQWFSNSKLPYDEIEMVGKHDKIEAVRKHNIDIFFEDKHDNAVAIAEEFDIPVILLDTPYNRLAAPKNVIRTYNWQEAKAWVNDWLRETSKV